MLDQIGLATTSVRQHSEEERLLAEVDRKVLWLSAWMIHHANHLRPSADGLKVGGHQASSASIATIMTALYFAVLRPQDRVAVKPHASPVFHAIQYLLGNQTREKLEAFRALGGAQSYPSRTKDVDDVDFSTGSVGLGAAQTIFASLVQDYVRLHGWGDGTPEGRMVALVGDAEMDEGNIYEALLEGSRHGLRNTWWVVDYNRQSLDAVIGEGVNDKIMGAFTTMGWEVVELKYGRLLQAAFAEPGGTRLRDWIDACPNQLYSALVFRGGAAWRERLLEDLGDQGDVSALLARRSDDELARLMTNLGGHDLGLLLDAFRSIDHDRPVCFLAYTIKGFGLPLAGHKDNHAGLMNPAQMDAWRVGMGIRPGHEWDIAEGLGITEADLRGFLARVPFNARGPRRTTAPALPVPETLAIEKQAQASTQAGFGQFMHALARSDAPIAERIVTTSPDVTVSTNLGAWVGRRGLFAQEARHDLFREAKIPSAYRWEAGPRGQHLELGIAEMNLFLMLSALGLSHSIFGTRLIPVGTLYDPFIARGLDAMNYACYQDARFILAATPSGITLAPEGGAHQSIGTPLIGMAQPGLSSYEPAFVDELGVIMRWALGHVQRDGSEGGSVYLRLSTRSIEQPRRDITPALAEDIVAGGYWLRPPGPNCAVAIAFCGAVAPEAIAAAGLLAEHRRDVGVLAVTSPDRLFAGWRDAETARMAGSAPAPSPVERLLRPLPRHCCLVTVADAHPAGLGWLGSVEGHRVKALGVDAFGQSGSIAELYGTYGLDAAAILRAAQAGSPGAPLPV
ncbi:transketolase [Neoroseomonas soli]|uniref:Pyruvate dehydrogenase E1 component n=1 Tax=Neoroseomonas soli TaxID=1081025 RepID=A0A9X9WWW7_9PROT|nr:transketolase [Neoroseomonas soli]MBR0671646.1 transketolase [Neoroseomonas soli]